ncbi:MAG: heparinase II/III family protein, partial [Armatimonadia bacterium]
MATTRLTVLPAFIILGLTLMSTTAAQPAAPDGFLVPAGEPFLRKLDLTRPELAPVKQALDRGDVPTAEAAFITYFRHKPLASPLLTNWDARERDPAYRNASAEKILAGHIDDGYSVYDVPSTGI